jgi:hypothetical protein
VAISNIVAIPLPATRHFVSYLSLSLSLSSMAVYD